MPLDKPVLDKLRCPKSGGKLVPAPAVLLRRLGLEAGFVSENAEWFYRVEEGFPILTAEAAEYVGSINLDWDQSYTTGETPWDKGEPAPPLVEFFEGGGEIKGRVFVPGCGRGHDARLLAEMGAEVTGFDISPAAVAKAKELADKAGIPGVEFAVGDLFDLPAEWRGAFDWTVEHTCLSGLSPSFRPAYFEAITSTLKAGGHLLAIWFINPDMDPGEPGPPFGIGKEEIQRRTSGGFRLVREWVPKKSFEGREGRALAQILKRVA